MIIIDTHCDTLTELAKLAGRIERHPAQSSSDVNPVVTYEHMKQGGVTLQVTTLWAGPIGPAGHPYERAMAQVESIPELTAQGLVQYKEFVSAKEDAPGFILSVEGAEVFEGSIERVHEFYDRGVRMCALLWNNENELGYPHCKDGDKPLKPFGLEAVREMNRLGIAIDVSHLGEGGFWDLIEHADKSPMASHSCCRALRDHSRNLTDDQIRALILRGGWIGINFYPAFLSDKPNPVTVQTVVDHIDHIIQLGGAGNVGFGSDFDGIESTPIGLEHPGKMGNLVDALRARYDEQTVRGIAGESFLRYISKI
jgi:membrane dipeptidase